MNLDKLMEVLNGMIVTRQQEASLRDYKRQLEYELDYDCPVSPFWEWYGLWCFEEGLFNDRMSWQDEVTQ